MTVADCQRPCMALWLGVLCATTGRAADPPTQWRGAHTCLLAAAAPSAASIRLAAVSASSGYSDSLYYIWVDADGQTLARGTMAPGETRVLEASRPVVGLQRLRVDPGRNAFSLEPSIAWCMDIRADHTVHTINHMRRLYFAVPAGLRELPISLDRDEAATVRIYGPDGSLAKQQSHEDFKGVEFTVNVPPGLDGRTWSLEGDLSQDLTLLLPPSVPPYVAEQPEWAIAGPRWAQVPGLVSFDERYTGRRELLAEAPAGKAVGVLDTRDGLLIGLDRAGRIASLTVDGQDQLPASPTPLTGILVRDVAADGPLLPLDSRARARGDGLDEVGVDGQRGLRLRARWTVRNGAVCVDGEVSDTTGRDRALTVALVLPLAAKGRLWWDDLDHSRPAQGSDALASYAPDAMAAGANGRISQYPLACVTGSTSLAWAVPMAQPRLFRLGYCPATGQAYAVFDLGLSPEVRKSPSRASFSVVLYRADPANGFRAALKRYYGLFPDAFEVRIPELGGWVCWGNVDTIQQIADYGFRYHWGPNQAEQVAEDDRQGLLSFLYSDSVRYYCDLGVHDSQPSEDQARAVMQAFLDDPSPVDRWLSAPQAGETAIDEQRIQDLLGARGKDGTTAWARRGQAAVRRSAVRDAQGQTAVGYIVHYEGAFPPKWWTGRVSCDLDPDIPEGFGQYQLRDVIAATFELWDGRGAHLDGVGLDNYYVDANRLDFAREHLAFADLPACFTRDGKNLVLLGAFETYEWAAALKGWLRARDGYLMNNACVVPSVFDVPLMDALGFEWNLEQEAMVGRALCYHKPVVSLPVASEHWEAPWIERNHVRFAALPGGYAGCDTPARRAVYRQYVPVLLAMARAGWEPVTRAGMDVPGVFAERFGGETPSDPLLFSVTNTTEAEVAATLKLDRGIVEGLPPQLVELIHGLQVPVRKAKGCWTMSLRLGPRQSACLRLRGPRAR